MDSRPSLPSWRSDLPWAVAIGVLGLGLRLAYVFEFSAHPYGRFPWVDENAYWRWANRIREGYWLPDRPFYQDPLFAYVLSGLMTLVGPDFAPLRIALGCLGALTPLAVFWAGREGLGRAEGIVAGLIAAVDRPLVFNDGLLEKEGLGALVAALALGLTARMAGPGREGRGAGFAGFAWGVLALLRANALIVAPLGAAWCLASFGARGERARGWLRALAFSAGFGLALAPAIAVNAYVADPPEFLLTTWQAGANFYIGNGPEARGDYTKLPFVIDNPAFEADNFMDEARRRTGRHLSPGEVSRYWFRAGLRRWATDPIGSLRLLAWKLALVANDFEISDNQSEELVREVVAPPLGWAFLSFGWVLPWSAVGLSRARGGRTPFWWFLTLSTLAGLISTASFFVVGRYRVPWIPGLALLAAAGVVDAARRAAARDVKGLAWRVVVLTIAAVAAWVPTASSLTPDRWALFYVKMFTAYDVAGRLDDALDAMDDARALDPRMAAYFRDALNSPMAREQRRRLVDSVTKRINLEADERDESSFIRVIRWLRLLPDGPGRAESRRLLDMALASHPDDPRLRRELGAWWLGVPDDPEARRRAYEELDHASRTPTGDPSATILFALLRGDPTLLRDPSRAQVDPRSTRARMAAASLRARRAR